MVASAAKSGRLRAVFFGNSQSLFSNRHFHALRKCRCDIVAVVDTPLAKRKSTNPARPAGFPAFTEVARKRRIRVFEPGNPNAGPFVKEMKRLRPDLFVAVGYIYLLKPALLGVPRILAMNFHASLLPAYRGKHPVFWALRNGEAWSGLTVHAMDPQLDTGDMLYQVRVRTRRRDSVGSLYERIMDRSVKLVPRVIDDAACGRLRRRPQGRKGASYYSSTRVNDFRLDWHRDAERLRRWICTSPGQCFFDISGSRVFVLDAEVQQGRCRRQPGTVVRIGRGKCTVATGRGLLALGRGIVAEGKAKSMTEICGRLRIDEGNVLD